MPWPVTASAAVLLIAWISALAVGWARLQRDVARMRAAHAERLADAARRSREDCDGY
jgi:hypothetical protein